MSESIQRVEIRPQGIIAFLSDGGRRRFEFGVIVPGDIASVHVADGREGILIRLRSGEALEWGLDQMTED